MVSPKGMKTSLSTREKLIVWLVILTIRILAPWEYEYQFVGVIKELTALLHEQEDHPK